MDLFGLIPTFGSFAFTVVMFIVALSIIIAVHEYGHYIVGRWTGIEADVFSLGFGPVLYSRMDRRGTRWQVAALPFGGYVKFRGDADAASGRDGAAMAGLSAAERRKTMHGAPLWARAATVAAGPAFNFVLAFLVFVGFYMVQGVPADTATVGRLKPTPFAAESLRAGDTIVALNGQPTPDMESFYRVADTLAPAQTADYTVSRDGQTVALTGPFPLPPVADFVYPQSAALDAGLRQGDVILSVDGAPIQSFQQLRDLVGASGGKALRLGIWRDGATVEATLIPRRRDNPLPEGGFETRWAIGLSGGLVFEPETRRLGPVEAAGIAAEQTWRTITTSLSGLWHIATGAISTCNLQGPVGIAETSGAAAAQGVDSFILFIAALSAGVGLLNLFPIPVLDGGHLVFHAYEAVMRRPPSDRALRALMSVGAAVLLAFMVFAIGNDLIWC